MYTNAFISDRLSQLKLLGLKRKLLVSRKKSLNQQHLLHALLHNAKHGESKKLFQKSIVMLVKSLSILPHYDQIYACKWYCGLGITSVSAFS